MSGGTSVKNMKEMKVKDEKEKKETEAQINWILQPESGLFSQYSKSSI